MSQFYPPNSFCFKLGFTGVSPETDASFQEASGISLEMETEEVTGGGENRFKYKLPGQIKFQNLVLKRGLVIANSPVGTWWQNLFTDGLNSTVATKTVTVSLLNEGKKVISWDFVNAYPVKWNVSEFKSMENAYAIESIEFAYNFFKKN